MSGTMLLRNEFMKMKRTGILWILLIPILFTWIPGIMNADLNFQMQAEGILPEYNFLVQSFMAYAWFMFPASLVITTVMLIQEERNHQGMRKMLALPIRPEHLCGIKYLVLLLISAVQILMMVVMYYIAAMIAGKLQGYTFIVPVSTVLKEAGMIYLSSIPMSAVFWLLTVWIHTPIFSIGIGLASIVPSVLFINTKVWFTYPMCYPFMLITGELQRFASNLGQTPIHLIPWLPVAIGITIVSLFGACHVFGQAERR